MKHNNKLSSIATAVLCLLGTVQAIKDAPCYGYGKGMGSPSNYLNDDLSIVEELQVGQGEVYV